MPFTYTSTEPLIPIPSDESGIVNLIVTPEPVVFIVHSAYEPLLGSAT